MANKVDPMSVNRSQEDLDLIDWTRAHFKPGCYLGDVSRDNPWEITDDEIFNMNCAREGYYAAGGV